MPRTGPITRDTSSIALGLAQIRVGNSAANIATITPVLASSDSIGALSNTKFAGNTDFWKLESGFPLEEDHTIPLRESIMLECGFKEISPYNLALARGIDPGGAINATVTEGITTGSGTTAGLVAVGATEAGPTTESWTVVFSTATTFSVFGSVSGHIGDGADLTSIFQVDNGGTDYFTIPANFFSGTWAADDTFQFATTKYVVGTAAYGNVHSGTIALGTLAALAFVRLEAVYTFPDPNYTMTIIFPRANVVSSIDMDLQAEDATAITISFESKGASDDNTAGNSVWNDLPLGQIIFA